MWVLGLRLVRHNTDVTLGIFATESILGEWVTLHPLDYEHVYEMGEAFKANHYTKRSMPLLSPSMSLPDEVGRPWNAILPPGFEKAKQTYAVQKSAWEAERAVRFATRR